jgi:ketosteroid isomerase-like protein
VDPVAERRDRLALTDLFHAYAFHFDRNEPEAVAALFTDDAVVDYGPEVAPIVGRPMILERVGAGLRDTFAATSHHVSNVMVAVTDATTATGVAYLYAWHRYRDGSPDGYLWGQYHDGFRRTPEGWRIASLQLRAVETKDFHRASMHPIGRRP